MDLPARNHLKLLPACLVFFFASVVVVFASSVFAKTDNQETGGSIPPQIVASDLKVEGPVEVGKEAQIRFRLNNDDNRVSYDIGYVVGLENEKGLFFEESSQQKFLLQAYSPRDVEHKFIVPAGLSGGKYKLTVAPTISSGLALGETEVEVEILGSQFEVGSISKAFISSEKLTSDLPSALAIYPNDIAKLNLTFNSPVAGSVIGIGSLFLGEGVGGQGVIIGNFEKQAVVSGASELTFVVKDTNRPGNYYINLQLVDEAGKIISPIQTYRWLVWGQGTYLKYITTDKSEAKAGEVIDVELAYLPVSLEPRKYGIFDIEVWVGGASEKFSVQPDEVGRVVSVNVKEDVKNPQIRVLASREGAVLFDYSTNPDSSESDSAAEENIGTGVGKSKNMAIVLGLFAILVLIGLFIKNKRAKSTLVCLVATVLFFAFIFPTKVEAGMSDSASASRNMCTSSMFGMVWSSPRQDILYRPGDSVLFNGNVTDDGRCSLVGSGFSEHRVRSADGSGPIVNLGTGSRSWFTNYVLPDSLDSVSYRRAQFQVDFTGSTRDVATLPGNVDILGTMSVNMGPRAVDGGTMNTSLPSCSNSNYNATFRFSARRLASNYRVEWATDSAFTQNTGSAAFNSLMDPAPIFPPGPAQPSLNQVHSTTTSPFTPGSTYYWRIVAYNSNAGSEITSVSSNFGPVNGCPLPPTNGAVTSGPSCVKNDGATFYTFVTTHSDANGAGNITQAQILINSTNNANATTAPIGAIALLINNSDGSVQVRNATDTAWQTSALGNGYAIVDKAATTRSANGNTLTANWRIRFQNTWVLENANIYLRTIDNGGLDTGWEDRGDVSISCPGPANPSNLNVTTSCAGASAEVVFTFTDNSNNEDLFWVDVNSAAWTGPGAPSPWGNKTLNRSATERSAVGGTVTWIWRASDSLTGTPGVPATNATYYWRVKANNSSGDSAHVYPPNTLTVPGASFSTPNCVVARPEIPTASGVDNLPSCVNPGLRYGPGLNLRWNAVANATEYTVRVTFGSSGHGDGAIKTVTTNSASGAGGWSNGGNSLVTWISGSDLALSPGVTYYFAVSARGPGGDSGFDLAGKSFAFGPIAECPPSNPSGLGVTAGCDASGREVVTFTFSDTSSNEDLFWLDVNGAAWTSSTSPSPWAAKTISRLGADKSGTGVVTFTWAGSVQMDTGDVNPAVVGDQRAVAPGTYWWRVRANNNTVGGSAHVYPANTTTPPGAAFTVSSCAPANPAIFAPAAPSCLASAVEIRFVFRDLSVNEDQFILEVKDSAWTGASGQSPFGTKVIARTPAQRSSGANTVVYVWRTGDGMTSGDTNSTLAGEQGTPEQGKTYWWRVRARAGTSNDSQNVYSQGTIGTLTPPGDPVVTPVCRSDISVSFVDGSWRDSLGNDPGPTKKFEPRERVSVDVRVENTTGNSSPATDLYIYYKNLGNQMPDCAVSTPRPATSVPVDSVSTAQGYSVPALNSTTPSVIIRVTLSVDSVDGSIYAFAVPKCEFDSSPWDNNVASQTYIVDSDGFIESQGGGVGAVGNIAVAVKSKDLTPSIYQGDYVINANTMNLNVDSKNNWIMKGYNAKQVPTGGLYEYFDTKFKGRAVVQNDGGCNFGGSDQFVDCKGNLTFNATDVAPNTSRVIFVEKDLRFKKNFELAPNASVLFIVKENVVVELGVNRIDGIFVVKGKFQDSDVADAGVADAAGALTVNGAVYVQNPASLELNRYFTSPINKTTPANRFVWDPKFLMQLSELVGSRSIVWKEVAP